MSNYGAKGSAPGFDVLTAVDYLLQFSSSWPLLKIHAGGSATITRNATPQTIYTHNLGYPALYFILDAGLFESAAGVVWGIGINGTNLGYDGSNPVGGSFSFYYYICRLPLDQNFIATQIAGSSTATASDQDFGFKVTKPSKDIDSTDMRDYSLHSSSRSLLIHQVDTGITTNNGTDFVKTTTHGLGYVPHGFSFMRPSTNTAGKDTSRYYIVPSADSGVASASYSIDSSTLSMRADNTIYTSAPTATSVILKDPFNKDLINVSFP